jgi:hypothetical protein
VTGTDDAPPEFSDERMQELLGTTRPYTLVLLHRGPRYDEPEARGIIWEHGRRNFELRAAGTLAVVLPVGGDALAGVGVFTTGLGETERIMSDDPAVRAGVLTAEFHETRGFPGDGLPGA